MRDYSKMSDEEVEALALRHYSDDEIIDEINESIRQIENGECVVVTKNVLDELFNRHHERSEKE